MKSILCTKLGAVDDVAQEANSNVVTKTSVERFVLKLATYTNPEQITPDIERHLEQMEAAALENPDGKNLEISRSVASDPLSLLSINLYLMALTL